MEASEIRNALFGKTILAEKDEETEKKQVPKPIFTSDFEDEEEPARKSIVDNDTKKEFEEEIEGKVKEIEETNEKLNKKNEALTLVIEHGNDEDKHHALTLRSEIEDYTDAQEGVIQALKQQTVVKEETKSQASVVSPSDATTRNTAFEVKGESADYLSQVLEKLEQVIELGEKILNKIDEFLAQRDVENKVNLTQNTQVQLKM